MEAERQSLRLTTSLAVTLFPARSNCPAVRRDRRRPTKLNLAALMRYQPVFPVALQPAASPLLRALPAAELAPAVQGFKVLVRGEVLSSPDRVYYLPNDLLSLIATSTGDTRTLALSLETRHRDGHILEECLRQLVAVDRPWVVPFVVQLVGEYVIEIVEAIAAAIHAANAAQFSDFVLKNPMFMATTRRRATSYWDCYHRSRFPTLRT